MQSSHFIFGNETPMEDVDPGIKRQILGHNDEIMLVKAVFESGAEGYQHQHVHSQVAFVESGVFDVTIAGVTKRQSKGDSFFVPPNVMHGAICIEAGVLLDMFSPIREDFFENYKKGDAS
ncbi:MAG: cupin [Robiginitomaculum sp.]|nr:MAG: cupin [Robiginitomaculum sp.]